MRDITLADTIYIAFSTRAFATGIPTTLAGSPVVSAYENVDLTQITAGITLGVDHDGVTGLHMLTIVATGANGYETGKDYNLVITTGTVGGVSVVGEVVGGFTIGRTSAAVAGDAMTLTDAATSEQLVDDVWDEVLTGATHNVTNSSGKRLRQIEAAFVLHAGTAQAGTVNTITLDAGASAINDFYNHQRVVITEATGLAQAAIIVAYNGTTKVATVAPSWTTTPDATSVFEIEPAISHAETGWATLAVGLAQAGAATTITLAADASATADFYKDAVIVIEDGTGLGQSRVCSAYNGGTKVATVTEAWDVNPDATSEYVVENAHAVVEVNNDKTGYSITGHTAQTGDSFARLAAPAGASVSADIAAVKAETALVVADTVQLSYVGRRGLGVFLDDAAANTNTVLGVDGIESNPVSTIAAATTIAGSLASNRIYLINDSVVTLAQTYEGWEFVGTGLGNQIDLGSQDVDNSCFYMMTITGTQGGTGMLWAADCSMTALVSLECIAKGCYLTGTNTVRASTLIIFDQCLSAVPGNNTPELTFSGGASAVNVRHYSGGLQLNSMGTGDTMSYESDGQIVVDATCTDGDLTVRGCCDITDNAGGNVTITQSAAINQANINAECDTALVGYDAATGAEVASVQADTTAIVADTGTDGVKLNATQPAGWAANLVASAGQIIKATVDTVTNTHTPTTTEFQADDITEATADHYKGAVVIFTSGALAGQRTDITAYAAVGGIGQFTVTAMTDAPANNDTFVII